MPNMSRTNRHGLRAAVTLALLATGSGSALADSYNLRTYFDSLQPSYPVQAASSQWSFYAGSAIGGSLIAPSGANYYGPETYQQIGSLIDVGTSGYAGPTTDATFDGVFVHPGSATPTSVVFRADSATTVTELKLLSEMVGNGHLSNGFDVSVRAYTNGGYHSIGSFGFDYGTTTMTFNQTIFNSPVALAAGEFIEISYGNAGSYLYDHGNIDVTVTTGTIAAPVPEPETYAMLLAGLGLLGLARRRGKAAGR
jgi:hypothetical protein